MYQLVPEFHTVCPYNNDATWYSWYAGTYQKISWYGIRPLLIHAVFSAVYHFTKVMAEL